MEKPDVDFIEGLSPAIAIEQRSAGTNPRSIIATTTEIYDYLRVLFSAVGQPHDPVTGQPIFRQTAQQIVDQILAYPAETKIILLAPLVQNERGEFRDVIEKVKREGFVRIRIDGEIVELGRPEPIRLKERRAAHDRSGGGSAGHPRRGADAAGGFGGDGAEVGWEPDGGAERRRENVNVRGPTSNVQMAEQWEEVRYSTDYGNPDTDFSLGALTPETLFL